MNHTYELSGGIGTVAVEGELTIAHAGELRSVLARSTEEAASVVIRFGSIDDVDLSCLQLLCSAHRTLAKKNKDLRMEGEGVRRIFSVAEKAGYSQNACGRPQPESNCLWTGVAGSRIHDLDLLSKGRGS